VWVREGEKTMSARVKEALTDFNTAGQLWTRSRARGRGMVFLGRIDRFFTLL
jgi:hypothetical protein